MAVKDKLVTLEDLAQLKNWVKGCVDMWQDITSSLTWSNASWLPRGGEKATEGVQIATAKVAKISVAKGERYRINSWITTSIPLNNGGGTSYGSAASTPYVLVDASENIIEYNYTTVSSRSGLDPIYSETIVTVPNSAKYMYLFDLGGTAKVGKSVGDIIVEKAL